MRQLLGSVARVHTAGTHTVGHMLASSLSANFARQSAGTSKVGVPHPAGHLSGSAQESEGNTHSVKPSPTQPEGGPAFNPGHRPDQLPATSEERGKQSAVVAFRGLLECVRRSKNAGLAALPSTPFSKKSLARREEECCTYMRCKGATAHSRGTEATCVEKQGYATSALTVHRRGHTTYLSRKKPTR